MFDTQYCKVGKLFSLPPSHLLLTDRFTSSHVLTGVIAFNALSSNATCSVTFSLVAAFLLFVLALPRTFTEMALLAYIDFASILAAIVVTLVTCGIEASKQPGGLQATEWYWFLPKERRSDWPQVIVA